MTDENKNELRDVPNPQLPALKELRGEILAIENELSTKLRGLELKWGVRVAGIDFDRGNNSVTLRCEVKTSKLR
jgi:hypothetical protein